MLRAPTFPNNFLPFLSLPKELKTTLRLALLFVLLASCLPQGSAAAPSIKSGLPKSGSSGYSSSETTDDSEGDGSSPQKQNVPSTATVNDCRSLCHAFRLGGKPCPDYALAARDFSKCQSNFKIVTDCLPLFRDYTICILDVDGYNVRQPAKVFTVIEQLITNNSTGLPGLFQAWFQEVHAQTRQDRSSFVNNFKTDDITFEMVLAPVVETIIAAMVYKKSPLALPLYSCYIALLALGSTHTILTLVLRFLPGYLLFVKMDKLGDTSALVAQHVMMVWLEIILLCFTNPFVILFYLLFFAAVLVSLTTFLLTDRSILRAPMFFNYCYNVIFYLNTVVAIRLPGLPIYLQALFTALQELLVPTSSFFLVNAPAFGLQVLRIFSFIPTEKKVLLLLASVIGYALFVFLIGALAGVAMSDVHGDPYKRIYVGATSFYGYPSNAFKAVQFILLHMRTFDLSGVIVSFGVLSTYAYLYSRHIELMFVLWGVVRVYSPYSNMLDIPNTIKAINELSSDGVELNLTEVATLPRAHCFDSFLSVIRQDFRRQPPTVEVLDEKQSIPSIVEKSVSATKGGNITSTTSTVSDLIGVMPIISPDTRTEMVRGVTAVVKNSVNTFLAIPAKLLELAKHRTTTITTNYGIGMGFWIKWNNIVTASHVFSDAAILTSIKIGKDLYTFDSLKVCNVSTQARDSAVIAQVKKEVSVASEKRLPPSKITVLQQNEIPMDKIGVASPNDTLSGFFYVGPNGGKIIPSLVFYDKFFTFEDPEVKPGYSGSPIFAVKETNTNGKPLQTILQLGVISCKFSDNDRLVGCVALAP